MERVTKNVIKRIEQLESEVVGFGELTVNIESVGILSVVEGRLAILDGHQYRPFAGKPGAGENATRQQYLDIFHHAEEVKSGFRRARIVMELERMAVGEERHFHQKINDGNDQYLTVRRGNEGYLLFYWRWDPGEVDLGYFKVTTHQWIPFLAKAEVLNQLNLSATSISKKELESGLIGFMIEDIEFGPEKSGMGFV